MPIEYAKTQPLVGSSRLLIKQVQHAVEAGMELLDKILTTDAGDEISLSVSTKKITAYFYQSASALNWIAFDGITALLELMQSAVIALSEKKSERATELQAVLHRSAHALTRHLHAPEC